MLWYALVMRSWESPETRLTRLFLDLFTTEELRAFIRAHFTDVSHALPGAIASPLAVAEAASEMILRRGPAELWSRLERAAPRRVTDIRVARDEVLCVLGMSDEAPLAAPALLCQRCGVEAGSPRACLGLGPTHEFAELRGEVYCSDCGTGPTAPIPACTGGRATHRFAAGSRLPTCRRCGRPAGQRSKCAGMAASHDFPGE